MVDVAIVGATGYGGIELIRLLRAHAHVRLAYLTSETYAGQKVCDVYPHLSGIELTLAPFDAAEAAKCDFAMMALPAGRSMEIMPLLLEGGARAVDVSPDFRLHDPAVYRKWYKADHACPELLAEAVFGVPELHREAIKTARLTAAPGCYPTGALLGLLPLVAEGLIDPSDIIVDGKSGVSGAGRTSLKLEFHFPEADEDVSAYSVGGHRHLPEMVQELESVADSPVRVTFTPHLVPMSRGILSTMYLRPCRGVGVEDLRACLARRYAAEPFVHVLPEGRFPHTKWGTGTNSCFLGLAKDAASGRAIVVSAIDNLGKGMAGQMVQCLNVMMGIDELTGLAVSAAYP